MTTWLEIRERIRRMILKDVPDLEVPENETRWADEEIHDGFITAIREFASHVAVASATSYYPATGTIYDLPENIFDGDELIYTGLVYFEDTAGTKTFVDPLSMDKDPRKSVSGYFIRGKTLRLNMLTLPTNSTLHVQYYAFYDEPLVDADVLNLPRAAEAAVMYLSGAHILAGSSLKTSFIRQWNRKNDSGNPVQNPVMEQMEAYRCLYDRELTRIPKQQRIKHRWWSS